MRITKCKINTLIEKLNEKIIHVTNRLMNKMIEIKMKNFLI